MNDVKVKGCPDLVRRGVGIINTNHNEYQRAQLRNQKIKREKEVESRVESLERKMDQILELLQGGRHG